MQRLFVYGTLKPGQERYGPLEKYCNGRNVELNPRPATTAGLLYALDHGYPGLMKQEPGDKKTLVQGHILNIDSDPAIVGVLNSIEGFNPFQLHNTFTPQRMYATVEYEDAPGLTSDVDIACWCYYYHPLALEDYFKAAKDPIWNGKTKAPILLESGNWDANNDYFDTLSGIHEEQFPPRPAETKGDCNG